MISGMQEALDTLLLGGIPDKLCSDGSSPEERKLADSFNQLIEFMGELHQCIEPLAKGELHATAALQRNNFLASPFKELHSRLLHLTWQAGQVAQGDYNQRVDFMGDFSQAFNSMVRSLDQKERQLKEKIAELEDAVAHIRKLEGILPICSSCKKIRLEGSNPKKMEGWIVIEQYIEDRSDARFTHSICPECLVRLYPTLANRVMAEDEDE
jgi:hypothetical protein